MIFWLSTTLGMLGYGVWVFYTAKLHKRPEFLEKDINEAAHETWIAQRAETQQSQNQTKQD